MSEDVSAQAYLADVSPELIELIAHGDDENRRTAVAAIRNTAVDMRAVLRLGLLANHVNMSDTRVDQDRLVEWIELSAPEGVADALRTLIAEDPLGLPPSEDMLLRVPAERMDDEDVSSQVRLGLLITLLGDASNPPLPGTPEYDALWEQIHQPTVEVSTARLQQFTSILSYLVGAMLPAVAISELSQLDDPEDAARRAAFIDNTATHRGASVIGARILYETMGRAIEASAAAAQSVAEDLESELARLWGSDDGSE
jgi:hypothetical protein